MSAETPESDFFDLIDHIIIIIIITEIFKVA